VADIGSLVKSLPMEMMFLAPLEAATKAHSMMCKALASFIDEVGLTKEGKVRMVRFEFTDSLRDEKGDPTGKSVQRVIDMPFLAAVPLPALGVQKVTVDFDCQVDTSESNTGSQEYKGSLSGSVGWGFFSASFSASVACKSEQTRKSDTRSRYTVHIEAAREGPPEALMRVIDAITAAATRPIEKDKAPALAVDVATTPKP